ncbi:SDR family oxidoreductase [Pedobacter sp. ASV28]|uniref:SDR family oxidoreductase n=1 Tax=Pedobacter sp. ASV28 TaxID=2795123 RepID=UPI0018EAF20D|nr:SDR family oxidoreductase [Pedobacter sp. ASV28]
MNAIITGATKGIGRAIALNLAKNGYNLALCARNHNDLNDLKIALETFGIKVLVIPTDCAKKEEVLNFAEQTMAFFDKVDVLVNNIGVFYPGSLLDEEDEVFEKQQRINVNTAYYLAKIFGKIMRKQCSGHIFNICSVASREVVENAGSYSVTKAAMLSLNHVLRKELAQYNVKVTAIIPGSTLTASWEGTTIDHNKFVQPEDIAKSLYTILNLSNGVNVDELVLKPLNFND